VVIVTSFTVAHSITLIASAYNLAPDALWFPPLIETLIAMSIVYMALENIVDTKKPEPQSTLSSPRDAFSAVSALSTVKRRWLITFGFGLVHGFGFAGALGELGLPRDAGLVSLASFNAGVELGQTAILAIALPVLFLAERGLAKRAPIAARAGIVYALSLIIAALGLWWLIDRTLIA
jgi:hypothetical protein